VLLRPSFRVARCRYKFHPDFDVALAEILRSGPPDSVVALVWGKVRHWTNALLQRFAKSMGPELTKRVILLPRIASSRMPSMLAAADVVLDTWPYGGGVTSFEALSVGRPLITLAYDTMPGRFTYAMYLRMGVWDCVAFNASE
jgi:protein O-GlcNAc transferase